MLPPVDPSILDQNPNFSTLYKDLCTRKLNPDGSTRDTKRQRIHDEIRANLHTSITHHHTTRLLLTLLSTLPSKSSPESLPSDLHPVIELMSARLSGHISSPADLELLSGDETFFLGNIDTIALAISEQLDKMAEQLCRIADPLSPPHISSLPTKASSLHQAATHDLPDSLATARFDLANTAHDVLTLHRQVLETSIRILEQTMHGSLSRGVKARAEVVRAQSALLGLQARIHTLTHPPPPEFVAALKNYRAVQRQERNALKDREALARQTLELYDKAGEKGMRDAARRAKVLQAEIQRTKAEIERLERG
ncbi:uncharacterized protein EI97DRAFT_405510, partial [Westerdykella ornata]